MKFGIVADSGCDMKHLRDDAPAGIDFTRVALHLDVGGKTFVDDIDLDVTTFMKEMYAYSGKTGSAAPSPDAFFRAYEKSENVFVVTITSALSASYSSSIVAEEMFKAEYPDRKIHVLDSKSTSSEMSLIVRKLTELIDQGLEFEEIASQIDAYSQKTSLLFVLQSLSNLVKNGRVSKLAGGVAGVLGIKALGFANERGEIIVRNKSRGKTKIYDICIADMQELGYKGGRVVVTHCNNMPMVEYVSDKILAMYPDCDIEVLTTSGLCSYYAEEGGVLVGFEVE